MGRSKCSDLFHDNGSLMWLFIILWLNAWDLSGQVLVHILLGSLTLAIVTVLTTPVLCHTKKESHLPPACAVSVIASGTSRTMLETKLEVGNHRWSPTRGQNSLLHHYTEGSKYKQGEIA